MTTLTDVVYETWRYTTGGVRQLRNTLSGAVTASGDTITLSRDIGAVAPGARVSVDLEDMHVLATASRSVTVERAVNGSYAEAHDDGAVVWVEPTESPFDILRAVNNELDELPSYGLFAVDHIDLTWSAGRFAYDLYDDTLLRVLQVHVEPDDTTSRVWSRLAPAQYRFNNRADYATFPSGRSIELSVAPADGRTVNVTYARPFTHLEQLTDDVAATTGLRATAVRLLPLGAAIQLLSARPVERAAVRYQPSRRAEEVSTSDSVRSLMPLERMRANWIRSERAQLAREFPYRVR